MSDIIEPEVPETESPEPEEPELNQDELAQALWNLVRQFEQEDEDAHRSKFQEALK